MKWPVVIIGGGLAGLALSIHLRKKNHDVLVIEQKDYPRHKVCGEYVSNESLHPLYRLCPAISQLALPVISRLLITSTGNQTHTCNLQQGGFGISRYVLEELMYHEAQNIGVQFMLNTKVSSVFQATDRLSLLTTTNGHVYANVVCSATGRNGGIKRDHPAPKKASRYIAVKYHVKLDRDNNLIELHNFPGGYCGISAVENGKHCLCYIVRASQLKKMNGSISMLETQILFQNKHLESIFTTADFVFDAPLTTSGIRFGVREAAGGNILQVGDAAGEIAPVTGNGMSNALRSAQLLADQIERFLSGSINLAQLNVMYNSAWKYEFESRIKLSRYIQQLTEWSPLCSLSIATFNLFPPVAQKLVQFTHGAPF